LAAGLIFGGAVLLAPGACVGMASQRWGQFVLTGAAVLLAFGLLLLTIRTSVKAWARVASRQALAVQAILLLVSWGILIYLTRFLLHWISINSFTPIR
jgi:hypothetical protein